MPDISHTMDYEETTNGRRQFAVHSTEGYLIGRLVIDSGWPTPDGPGDDPWSYAPAAVTVDITAVL